MAAFWRGTDGVCAVVAEPEAALVRRLVTDVQAMLTEDMPDTADEHTGLPEWPDDATSVLPPEDPALARLLPDGYRDDPAAAAELRRLTEQSLRQAKSRSAQRLLDSLPGTGGSLTLDLTTASAWLGALNDVRLVLGTRLGVSEDTAENDARGLSQDGEDPVSVAYQVYSWLGVIQDDLITALTC